MTASSARKPANRRRVPRALHRAIRARTPLHGLDRRPGQQAVRAPSRRGARLLQVITQAGIDWTLARTWEGTRERERQLKRQGGAVAAMPDLPRRTTGRAMSEYRVIVTDQLQSALAGHDGVTYQSLPQPHDHALELVRALVGLAHL